MYFELIIMLSLLPPYSKENGTEYLEDPLLVSNELGLYCRCKFWQEGDAEGEEW